MLLRDNYSYQCKDRAELLWVVLLLLVTAKFVHESIWKFQFCRRYSNSFQTSAMRQIHLHLCSIAIRSEKIIAYRLHRNWQEAINDQRATAKLCPDAPQMDTAGKVHPS